MFSIKTAVAAIIVLGCASLSAAPAFAAKHRHATHAQPWFENHDVSLPSTLVPPAEEQWFDRATQSFGGGK